MMYKIFESQENSISSFRLYYDNTISMDAFFNLNLYKNNIGIYS